MSVPMQDEIKTFEDIIRLLQERPALREQLRQLLLTQELLALPQQVAQLAEAVSRLERQVDRLAQAQERAEERLGRLEERVGGLEERVGRLEEALARLAEAQARTEERVGRLEARLEELAAAQARTEQELATLAQQMQRLARRLDSLDSRFTGDFLERRYRDHAYSYFGPILRRIRPVSREELWQLLDEAVEAGRLSEHEAQDISRIDVLVRGRTHGGEAAYLAVEVSSTIYPDDVQTVQRRRDILARCLDAPVLAAVAGETIVAGAEDLARPGLYRVLDGVVVPPGSPAPRYAIIEAEGTT
ncbi:Chromosome partition protein Smc [bacterium HR24]|nr:Chromosome partition protein Smc [bacterium HR24]